MSLRPTPGAILEALRDAVTIVEPGEILAVRIEPGAYDRAQIDQVREHADFIKAEHGITVIFIEGAEFARVKPGVVSG